MFLGCKKEESTEGLKISNLVFCSEINGDRDYVERTDRTFSVDEPTYVYVEVSNLTSKSVDNKLEYWLILEVEVKDPNGDSIIERQKIVDQKLQADTQAHYIYVPITLTFPETSPKGKYEVFIYTKDGNSERTGTASDYFYIE
jgi:hypothetical protein